MRWLRLSDFIIDDLATFDSDMASLTGVAYGGVSEPLTVMPHEGELISTALSQRLF